MSKLYLHYPSTGTILGFIAVFISLGGFAVAAGSLVTIVDPTTSAKAKVTAGRLEVSVDETVTTRTAAPATFFHTSTLALSSASGCRNLATAPAGRAFIVTQVRVDTFSVPTPGSGNYIRFWAGANCTGAVVGAVNPATVGHTVVPFDPGLGIPQGQSLSASIGGSPAVELYVDGFSIPAAQVPAAAEVAQLPAAQIKQMVRQ